MMGTTFLGFYGLMAFLCFVILILSRNDKGYLRALSFLCVGLCIALSGLVATLALKSDGRWNREIPKEAMLKPGKTPDPESGKKAAALAASIARESSRPSPYVTPGEKKRVTETYADGSRKVTEISPDGKEEVVEAKYADGSGHTIEVFPGGIKQVTEFFADGSSKVTEIYPDGTRKVAHISADGTQKVDFPTNREEPIDLADRKFPLMPSPTMRSLSREEQERVQKEVIDSALENIRAQAERDREAERMRTRTSVEGILLRDDFSHEKRYPKAKSEYNYPPNGQMEWR